MVLNQEGILTDQCRSIELRIKHVFGSETTQRYCSWNILHKLPTKLGRREKESNVSAQEKESNVSWHILLDKYLYIRVEYFEVLDEHFGHYYFLCSE